MSDGAPLLKERLIQTQNLGLYALHCVPQASKGKVLLLGGSNFDLRLKRQFLQSPLAATFEIATYEPRGIGRSEQPAGHWTMHDYASDALSLMDALGWQHADIVGESFGGMTALHMAVAAPGRIGKMALASTTAGGAGGSSYDIAQFLTLPPHEAAARALKLQDSAMADLHTTQPDVFQQRVAERMAFEAVFADPSIKSGGYQRLLAARAGHDVWALLPSLAHETLVIIGQRDQQASPVAQCAMASQLPNAKTAIFDAGHGVAFSTAQAMQTLCDQWLGHTAPTNTHHEEHYG